MLLGAGAAALAGGGLVLSIPLVRRLRAEMRKTRPIGGRAWIQIEGNGRIRAYSNVGEMGQGSITGLLQCLADELDADWRDMSFALAPVVEAFDGPNGHYTGGSSAITDHFILYRELGARARAMLVRAAAKQWQVSEQTCETQPGLVIHPASGRRAGYGELADAAGRLRVPRKVLLKPPSEWRYIGKAVKRLDSPAKVDGSAVYGIDISIPNMRFAAIRHCPVKNGTLKSVNEEPALRVRGVFGLVRLDDAVAVIANGYWSAQKGVDALDPLWTADPTLERQSTAILSNALGDWLAEAVAKPPVDTSAADNAHRTITAVYSVPLLAQCPLEPMNALADVRAGKAELWVSTQAPSQCQRNVASALGIAPEDVVVHPQQMGGGFGRRLQNDYAVEAALISRAAGAPVKVVWSRPEDFLRTSLRTASMARCRGMLDDAGMPSRLVVDVAALDGKPHLSGLSPLPYDIPEVQVRYAGADSAARIGYWRSVDHSQNIFFLESFIDECAAVAKMDGLSYRRRLLHRNSRALELLDQLQALVNEVGSRPPDVATGWAYFEGYGGRVAAAVQLAEGGGPPATRRHTLFCVADCGLAVNPALVETQLQGAALQAYSAALYERIDLQEGRILQRGFAEYGLLTMRECPAVHTRILSRLEAAPTGVGELAVPVIAPALANAWAAATGARFRSLPLAPRMPSPAT